MINGYGWSPAGMRRCEKTVRFDEKTALIHSEDLDAIQLLDTSFGEAPRDKRSNSLVKGILCSLGCSLMLTFSNAVQKYGNHSLTFWQLLLYRGIGQTIFMFGAHTCLSPPCSKNSTKLDKSDPAILSFLVGAKKARSRMALQGFLGGCLLLGMYGAVNYIPLASATAIFFSTPVFTFLMATFMLKERCRAYRLLISALMIIGVVFITKPGFKKHVESVG